MYQLKDPNWLRYVIHAGTGLGKVQQALILYVASTPPGVQCCWYYGSTYVEAGED